MSGGGRSGGRGGAGGESPAVSPYGGLCAACRHARTITSAKGSVFVRCSYSDRDRAFPKYPPQPVLVCSAAER
ncbi:MAG: hypothetical protein AAF682_05470 [Planctomycetota bacterium]